MIEYVEKWIKIMEKDNFKSTYQVVFGKAVIEVTKHYNLIEDNDDSDLIIVSKDLIANTMIHLYWKHSYMYRLNLKQGSGNLKILELIDEIIENNSHVEVAYLKSDIIFLFEKTKEGKTYSYYIKYLEEKDNRNFYIAG